MISQNSAAWAIGAVVLLHMGSTGAETSPFLSRTSVALAGTTTGWFGRAFSPVSVFGFLGCSKSEKQKLPILLQARPGVGTMLFPVHSGQGKLGGQPRFKGKRVHLLMGGAVCTYS